MLTGCRRQNFYRTAGRNKGGGIDLSGITQTGDKESGGVSIEDFNGLLFERGVQVVLAIEICAFLGGDFDRLRSLWVRCRR